MPRIVLAQRIIGILVAIVLCGFAVYAAQRPNAPGIAPSAGSPQPTAGPSSASLGPTPLGSSTASTSAPDSVATTGPGLTDPGVHVVARAGADGALEVVERVRTAVAITSLSVRPPRSASASGTAGAAPTVIGLQAEAGGMVVSDVPPSPLPTTGFTLTLPRAAKEVVMRYRLENGADRSQPAPVGRVLILLAPITAGDKSLGTLTAVVEVVGGNVHNLVCPSLAVSDQLCGRQHGSIWSTTAIPLATSAVVAQVDLPQPGDR